MVTRVLAALLIMAGMPVHADDWSVSGFYSLTGLKTSRHDPLFAYAPAGDQDRPARLAEWDMESDSKLGMMVHGRLAQGLDIKGQWLLRRGSSKESGIRTRLAFMEYRGKDPWTFRLGRQVQDLVSDEQSLYTDFASNWVRAPQEPFVYIPITEIDGLSATYALRSESGQTTSVYFLAGESEYFSQQFKRTFKDYVGISLSQDGPVHSWSLGYRRFNGSLGGSPSLAAATAFIRDVAVLQGRPALVSGYDERHIKSSMVGASYEFTKEGWHAKASLLGVNVHFEPLPETFFSAYVHVGHRFGNWTPYMTLGRIRDRFVPETRFDTTNPSGAAAAATADYLRKAIRGSQQTTAIGIRYDLNESMSIKAQLDQVFRPAGVQGWFVAPAGTSQFAPNYDNRVRILSLSLQGVF